MGRPPPDWQLHRDKAWGGKTFIAGVSSSGGGGSSSGSGVGSSAEAAEVVAEAAERARIAAVLAAGGPPPPPQKRTCHFWDGQVCLGEMLFWPGKKCRYAAFHLHGVDTIEPYKLQQECERRHIPNPHTAAAAAAALPDSPSPEAVAAAALEAAAAELAAAQPT